MKKSILSVIQDIKTDFDRYSDSENILIALAKMLHNPGMQFSIVHRVERYLLYESNGLLKIIGTILYPLHFVFTYYILSYHIEPLVKIGSGLFMHNRDIVITDLTSIGKNFSIMGQTTIGTDFSAKNVNIIIGDNVRIGVGAKIIAKGKLIIEDGVTIGANAVLTKNAATKNGIYAGIPAVLLKPKRLQRK